jgi:hypothetical protein
MTDDKGQLEVDLTLGFDSFGEPLLMMKVQVPEGGAVPLDSAEDLALHILGVVAMGRANAALSRTLMLDGMPPQEVQRFLQKVMGAPAT